LCALEAELVLFDQPGWPQGPRTTDIFLSFEVARMNRRLPLPDHCIVLIVLLAVVAAYLVLAFPLAVVLGRMLGGAESISA
jgi:hypothetical protein